MNDEELDTNLRDYYGSLTPADSVRAANRVSTLIAAARLRPSGLHRPGRALALAVTLAIVAIIVAVPLAFRPGTGPAASPSPTASESATPLPNPTPSASPSVAAPRYPGGIPMSLDGEPVYLGLGAVVHADATTDATPFLVGGWFVDGTRYVCTGGPIGIPHPDRFRGCVTFVGGDSPWGFNSSTGPQGRMAWNGHSLPNGAGPSIVRVHTHDPLSAQCGNAQLVADCEAILVVDEVLWTGDATTGATPISVAEAVGRLNAIQRGLVSATIRQQPCQAPWPSEVFDLRGDPRFALLAVFPDEASRVSAQPLLDSAADACPTDPRVVRPGERLWVGQANVLVLVYGVDVATATQKALSIPTSWDRTNTVSVASPSANLDESYQVLSDFLATRESGFLLGYPHFSPSVLPIDPAADPGAVYNAYAADAKRRYQANALSSSIGPAQTPSQADVGPAVWTMLADRAAPGTARLFEVDHPESTDPALRHEVYVAYQYRGPSREWELILVDAAPWTAPAS